MSLWGRNRPPIDRRIPYAHLVQAHKVQALGRPQRGHFATVNNVNRLELFFESLAHLSGKQWALIFGLLSLANLAVLSTIIWLLYVYVFAIPPVPEAIPRPTVWPTPRPTYTSTWTVTPAPTRTLTATRAPTVTVTATSAPAQSLLLPPTPTIESSPTPGL